MSYSRLTIIERLQLETLHRLGWSSRAIAKQLGRHHPTIAREIVRGQMNLPYEAAVAQEVYQEWRACSVPVGKFSPGLASELKEKLDQT